VQGPEPEHRIPPSRRRPQARGRVTRARLLAAAEELFTRRGYAGTGVSDIAERAGIGVGTVYHHFADKRAILLDLIDDWGDRLAARRRSELDLERFMGDDARQAIRHWLRRSYERLRKEPSLYLVVLALAERDPEVRSRYQRIEQMGALRIRELVEFGQRRGLMRRQLDGASAAFLCQAAIDMAATQLLVREVTDPDPDRVLEELTDMLCRYLLEDPR
jgi:AcrR family transcriptional regulator